MKKLQLLVLLFVMGTANVFASEDFYEKPDNTRRANRTVRNSPEERTAKDLYIAAAQVRVEAKPKVVALEATKKKQK